MRHRPNRSALAALAVLALVVASAAPTLAVPGDVRVPPGASTPTAADWVQGGSSTHHAGWSKTDTGGAAAGVERERVKAVERFGDAARARGGLSGGGSDVERHRFELVTGETVVVRGSSGRPTYEVVSGGPVRVVTMNDRTYLLPDGVDLGTYDRSLFEVGALAAARSGGEGLPVLLHTDASTAALEAAGLRDVRRLESAGVVAAELNPGRGGGAVGKLVDDGLIRGVSLDRGLGGTPQAAASAGTPPVPGNLTGAGVTVAVLDTGIDSTHPSLRGTVVDRVDLVDDQEGGNATDPASDANGHGTYVAGVLAGTAGGGTRAGVAPGVDLVDVRVMDDRGAGRASTIIEGIEYAVERDVDVILLSVGTAIDGGDAIAESVEWAAERGVVVVAAAGNGRNPRTIGAPGRPAGAVTVGATDGAGGVAAYSSRGPTLEGHLKPDLLAPGREVPGPRSSGSDRPAIDEAGRYTWVTGTSAAAPQVAGAAALLLEAEPDLTAREIRARLASTARPVAGGGAYAQGGGAIDVAGALDPDVVVDDPVIDVGLLEDDRTVNRTITLANHDDRRHELSFDVRVRNVDLGVDANGTASLSRDSVALAPGERANLTLSIDGATASGAHAGEIRYSVAGEPRSVVFGFVRGGTVTVEKRPLSAGTEVEGDALWVLTEEGTHDELLEFDNGTASFVAGGGTYVLWSWGLDEPTGMAVFLSERRTVDGPTRVVLDEGAAVPVGVDAGPIETRYGRLANLSVTTSLSTASGPDAAKLSVSRHDVDSRSVRVTPDPELDVATTYLLASRSRARAALDVPDVFQLGHGVEGVAGPSVVEATPGRLSTAEHRLHRATEDETYRVQDRMRVDGVWNQVTRRWFDLGGRSTQRVHRFPATATYHRAFSGRGWDAHRASPEAAGSTAEVLAHPMHGLIESLRFERGTVAGSAAPFSDGDGTRFDPEGDHRLAVWIDGEVVRGTSVRGGSGSFEDVRIRPGDNLTVRVVGENPEGYLSTRTLTEVSIPRYRSGDGGLPVDVNRPPIVSDVAVRGASEANAVEPGEVTAVYEVDAVGPLVDPTVWYAVEDPTAPPWRDATAWRRVETERFDGRLIATFPVGEGADTLSLAAQFRDIRGHRTRTMTVDAVHVGAAPNTSTSILVGRFLAPDGTAAANDTVVVDPVGPGATRFVSTGEDGRMAVELPRGRSYDLTYLRGGPWDPREPADGGPPAWLPLSRVRLEEDVDLGTRSLPAAGELQVRVTDERGRPVEGASVRLTQRSGNVTFGDALRTGPDGVANHGLREGPGIRLAGTVGVTVEPPDEEVYPEQTHRLNVSPTEGRHVNVTVETAPPEAVLTAFGRFEAGEAVFLHARKSAVPAGAAEYRWDLDGDGAVDRVTRTPAVRSVPGEGTYRPTVTVVDEAGKTDASTLTLEIEAG